MMTSIERTLRSIWIGLAVLIGAALFYVAGLGSGLYVGGVTPDRVPQATVAWLPSPTPPPNPDLLPTGVPTALPSQAESDAFGVFWEAWQILQADFYGSLPTDAELPYEAIRGVLASTGDPYTAFLDPQRAELLRTDLSGSFDGIGATVRLRPDGKIEIVQPLAGWPAIKAGLRPQDTILQVDGVDVQGMTLYEVISLIRGPARTDVRLLIERSQVDQPFEVTITRERIELPVVESRMLDHQIGYLRLTEYGQTATAKLKQALRDLDSQSAKGLILDLRGNRGGYLTTAIEVTSQFVGTGVIVTERFQDSHEQIHNALPGGLALDIPLVVLVDGSSASAAEITAGAIQDTERGVLIGSTTLGKGSVQVAHNLSDGSELRVTVARWFTPNGRGIHGEGLAPDIEVEITADDLSDGRDPQLDRAIQYLIEGN